MSEAENMAIKISKRIVDYKIQKDDEPTAASAAPQVSEKETMHEDIDSMTNCCQQDVRCFPVSIMPS